MNTLNPSDTYGILIDGSDFYIPDPEIKPDQNPCHLTASLKGIYYSGQDVGSRWQFDIIVNSGAWTSGSVHLSVGNWYPGKENIYDETLPGGCNSTHLITIFIRAREYDFYIFDDVGERLLSTAIQCTPSGEERSINVLVPVAEYPYCRIFRKNRRVAFLHFFFLIKAKCV